MCSNYHWLADPAAWLGGLLHEEANAALLLNLAAAAAAVPAPAFPAPAPAPAAAATGA